MHHDISSGQDVRNIFLIKGYIDTDLSAEFDVPVIYVEDWDIIFPVRRRVQHWVDGEGNDRIFSPLICLDKHDVSTGLYCDIYPDFRAIDEIEKKSIILKSDLKAFELKADIADGMLQWKRKGDEDNISNVTLKEDVISRHFSEEILEWNTFLVLGTIDENGVIDIDEWYMLGQISKPQGKMIEKGIFHVLCVKDTSRYYFSQEEVAVGWYKP